MLGIKHLNSRYNMYIGRELVAKSPLVEGRFTESLVCLDNSKPNRADNRPWYTLMNN